MKRLVLIPLLFVLFGLSCSNISEANNHTNEGSTYPLIDTVSFRNKAKEALSFAKKNQLNTGFCILIDMSVHSGLRRWIEWDLVGDSIITASVVSHGCGSNPSGKDLSKDNPQFSNEPETHKSSLGKYKIGAKGVSRWGIKVKYLLHGLESTNSNALERNIVLHSWEMSDIPTYPHGAPESWGCPAVPNSYLSYFDKRLQSTKQPVLMWIYN